MLSVRQRYRQTDGQTDRHDTYDRLNFATVTVSELGERKNFRIKYNFMHVTGKRQCFDTFYKLGLLEHDLQHKPQMPQHVRR